MLQLLFPQHCAICRRPGAQLCDGCAAGLRRLPPPLCERCGAPTAWPVRRCGECAGRRLAFVTASAAVIYEAHARLLIRSWKERGLRGLANAAADLVVETTARPAVDGITFVPPDGDRSLVRGHHPAAGLAAVLGKRWELPVISVLRRTRETSRQAELALAARRTNLRGAFAATQAVPRRMCLVDDVYTSGGTAHAAASALRKGGARTVSVVTFARAVR